MARDRFFVLEREIVGATDAVKRINYLIAVPTTRCGDVVNTKYADQVIFYHTPLLQPGETHE